MSPQPIGALPVDAATLMVLRDNKQRGEVEVFCVKRNSKSRFLPGAVVFPGGRVDPSDRDPIWSRLTHVSARLEPALSPFRIAACRETFEEAALLPAVIPALPQARIEQMRAQTVTNTSFFFRLLLQEERQLDLTKLPFLARWITPLQEPIRFDTFFFGAIARPGQTGLHDEHETTASFWTSPRELLNRSGSGELLLAPPTYCMLELVATLPSAEHLFSFARNDSNEPIVPHIVPFNDTRLLLLPGDPEHNVRTGLGHRTTRFLWKNDRWLPHSVTSLDDMHESH